MTAGVGVIIVMHRLRVIVRPIIRCINCFVITISAFFASEPNPLVLHQLVPVSGSPATWRTKSTVAARTQDQNLRSQDASTRIAKQWTHQTHLVLWGQKSQSPENKIRTDAATVRQFMRKSCAPCVPERLYGQVGSISSGNVTKSHFQSPVRRKEWRLYGIRFWYAKT